MRNPERVQALSWIVAGIRPDWDQAGIARIIHKIDPAITWPAVCHAAIVAAATRDDQRTPAIIAMSGAHWAGCTGDKPTATLPTWTDRDRDTQPASPATVAAHMARIRANLEGAVRG